MVPLGAFTTVSKTVQPNGLATFQQLNSAMLQGVPFPGRTIGEGIAFLQQKADELMPQGMAYDFKGESRQFVKEGNTLAITFAVALLLIYLVLAAQFESFRDPFIILIALPTSIFGALRQVMVRGLDKVDQLLTLNMAAYNLTRLRSLAPLRPQGAQ